MSEARVFVGPWSNWSTCSKPALNTSTLSHNLSFSAFTLPGNGRILGATITIPAEYGSIAVAILALFVRLVGSHFWGITCFVLHQIRYTPHDRDGFHHQYQAILGNKLTDLSTFWKLLKVALAWRSNTDNLKRRALPLLFLTVFHMAAFYAAGIFSSRVSRSAGEVLVKSDVCGWPDERSNKAFDQWSDEDMESADAWLTSLQQSFRKSAAYTQSCYNTQSQTRFSPCNVYAVPSIKSRIDRAAACPFFEGICPTTTISIDSGLIDSHFHLGINAPVQDRIQFRKLMTCTPIPLEGNYSSNWTSEKSPSLQDQLLFQLGLGQLPPDDLYKYYYLGNRIWKGAFISDSTVVMTNNTITYASQPYNLLWVDANPGNPIEGTFNPIPALNRTDADVNVLLLNNLAAYTGPVGDPWFQTAAGPTNSVVWAPSDVWISSNTLSGIGCTEQYQFCRSHQCTPLTGIYMIDQHAIDKLSLNLKQGATLQLLLKIALWMRMSHMLTFLGGDTLLAKERLFGGTWLSSALENNHWQREIENIYNTSMAFLQQRIIDHASPSNSQIHESVGLYQHIMQESHDEILNLCANQKVWSIAHHSFNVVGIMLIIFGGFLVILVDVSLPQIVGWLQRRSGRGLAARLDWIESEPLHLQRIAFESCGIGSWKAENDGIPITEEFGQKFRSPRLYSSAHAMV